MSKLLTTFKRNAIDAFIADTANNQYFVFVGGQTPYANSEIPVELDDDKTKSTVWNEMMFGREASFIKMVKKYQWTSGETYAQYDDSVELKAEPFFVITSSRDVFKCIYNNNGAPSTVEPTKRASRVGYPVEENDGYEWLYLYTVSKSDYTKYATKNYIPVVANTTVESYASDGALLNIRVDSSGEDYVTASGTIASVSGVTTFQLETTASSLTNVYKDSSVMVTDINGRMYVRKILSNDSSRTIITDPFPAGFLNTSCTYYISPTVTITSRTGSGATAYCVMAGDSVQKVQMLSYGNGYKDATVTITAGFGVGSGAEASAIISPNGGHGSNVYDELYCESLGVSCLFDEWEMASASQFNTDVTYRNVGILKNPLDLTSNAYQTITFNQIATINTVAESGSGVFEVGEIVTTLSGKFGKLAFSNSSCVLLTGTNDIFDQSEQIQGLSSDATRIVSEDSLPVDLKLYSGDVLYVENIQEVTRSATNKEQVKLVISF